MRLLAKLICPEKSMILRPFAFILLGQPTGVDLVEWTVAAWLPLATDLKIIDFPGK
jgi:hypothetical protein